MGESSSSAAQALERLNTRAASVGLLNKSGAVFTGADFEEVLQDIAELPTKERKPAIAQFVHVFGHATEEISVGFLGFKEGATKLVGDVEDIFQAHKAILNNGNRIRNDREALRKILREEFLGGEMSFPFYKEALQTNQWTKNTRYFIRDEKPLFLEMYPALKNIDLSTTEHFVRYCAMRLSQSQQLQIGKADHVRGAQKMAFSPVNVDGRRHWKVKRSEIEGVKIFNDNAKNLRFNNGFKLDRLGFTVKRAAEEMEYADLSEPTSVDPPPSPHSEDGRTLGPEEDREVTPTTHTPAPRESRQTTPVADRETPVADTPGLDGLNQPLEESTLACARKPTAPAPELMITTSQRPLRDTDARRKHAEKMATPVKKKKGAALLVAEVSPTSSVSSSIAAEVEKARESAVLPSIEEEEDDDDPFAPTPCDSCSRWLFKSGKQDKSDPTLFHRCFVEERYGPATDVMVLKREIAGDYMNIDHSGVRASAFCAKHVVLLGELLGLAPVAKTYPEEDIIARVKSIASIDTVAGLGSLVKQHISWFTPEFRAAMAEKTAAIYLEEVINEDDFGLVGGSGAGDDDDFGDQFRIKQNTSDTVLSGENHDHLRRLLANLPLRSWEKSGVVVLDGGFPAVPEEMLDLMRREFAVYRWHGKPDQFGHNRMMWHSATQQILRQNPVYFLLYLVLTDAVDYRCLAYPSPAIHCYEGDGGMNVPDGHQFIAASEQTLKRGEDQELLQFVVHLDAGNSARQLLISLDKGFADPSIAKAWAQRMFDKGAALDVGFSDVNSSADFTEFCDKIGANWARVDYRAGNVAISHPYIPQRLTRPAGEFRAVPIQFLPLSTLKDDSDEWNVVGINQRGLSVDPSNVIKALRTRTVLLKTSYGFQYPLQMSGDHFLAEKLLEPMNNIGSALLGRMNWDEPEVNREINWILQATPEEFADYVDKWWAEAIARLKKGLAWTLAAEESIFGKESFGQNNGDFARAPRAKKDRMRNNGSIKRVVMDDRI